MKVTIGELLGIAKQAKALKWSELAQEFKKVEKINALKNTAVAQLSATFSSLLNAFSLTKQIADLYQQARPIITLAVKVVGAIKNWAMAAEIASDILLLAKKLLIKLAMQGLEQVRDYILAIEIDLGDLTFKQIKALRNKIKKSLEESFTKLNEAIAEFDPMVLFPNIEKFKEGVNTLITDIETAEWDIILMSVGSTLLELSTDILYKLDVFDLLTDENIEDDINEKVYGDADQTLSGIPPAYVSTDPGTFFNDGQININALENPPPTSDGDLTWQTLVADDNDITREMMDAFEKTINENINKILNELFEKLLSLLVDTTDIEKDIYANNGDTANEDIKILNNLKDGFLAYIREGQYTLAKDALKGIFKLNDYVLKNLLNLFLKELSNAVRERNAKITELLKQYIETLIANGIEDVDVARQLLLDYLAIIQENLAINMEELYRKVMMAYLKSIFGSLSVNNEERAVILVDKALSKFYQYRRNFLLNIIEKIKRIRLQNDTIDENFYIYEYDTLKASLISEIASILNTANAITYSGEYKYDGSIKYGSNAANAESIRQELKTNLKALIDAYIVTVTENTPHPIEESIEEKISIFKSELYKAVKQIIDDEPLPETIWSEDEWLNVTDKEKEMLRLLLDLVFNDFKRKLLKIASNAIFLNSYTNIKMIQDANTIDILENYSITSDLEIKNKFYEAIEEMIDNIQYNNDFEQYKIEISYYLEQVITNFNCNLNHSIKLATLLKENEIEFIKEIVPIYMAS